MRVLVPDGFIRVNKTKRKGSTGVDFWDVTWRPVERIRKPNGQSLLIRASSFSSERDAILRLKHKVANHFGGPAWTDRAHAPKAEPLIDGATQPWMKLSGSRSKPDYFALIPDGKFETTTSRRKEVRDGKVVMRPVWITTWRPKKSTRGLSSTSSSGYFEALSRVSAATSEAACARNVGRYFESTDMRIQRLSERSEELDSLREQRLLAVQAESVSVPHGQVRVFLAVHSYGSDLFETSKVDWNRVVVEWSRSPKSVETASCDEWLGPDVVHMEGPSLYAALTKLKRSLIRAAVTPSVEKAWSGVLPDISPHSDPWGIPIVNWENDILPGVAHGELEHLHYKVGNDAIGHIGKRGHFVLWRPAREVPLLGQSECRQIIVGFGKTSSEAFNDCLSRVETWLRGHYPDEASRPELPQLDPELPGRVREILAAPLKPNSRRRALT